MKVLVSDDNKQIVSILSEYLKQENFEVIASFNGIEAIQNFEKFSPDIALLDVMMPKKDGFEVCRYIRKTSNIPIIFLTAKSEDFEKITGLDIGADDYITKPFSPSVVMAKIRAIMRRSEEKQQKFFQYDNLKIDIEKYIVEINNQKLNLTKKEIEILWLLATNKKAFSRDNILNSVWGYDYFGDSRTVDTHIKRLRSKLSQFKNCLWSIKTIWGVGYKFETNQDDKKQDCF